MGDKNEAKHQINGLLVKEEFDLTLCAVQGVVNIAMAKIWCMTCMDSFRKRIKYKEWTMSHLQLGVIMFTPCFVEN